TTTSPPYLHSRTLSNSHHPHSSPYPSLLKHVMSSFAEREVEVLDLSQEEEVTLNTTTVTTTATRSVTREVVAPADSGLRRREVQGRSAAASAKSPTSNERFLPCEYYGRDA